MLKHNIIIITFCLSNFKQKVYPSDDRRGASPCSCLNLAPKMGKKAAPLDEKGKMKSCRRVEKTRMENSTARHLKKLDSSPFQRLPSISFPSSGRHR